MGSDHSEGNLPRQDGWSKELHDAINQPFRVHGFWVNSTDTLFYVGKTQKLNEMVRQIAKTDAAMVKVVLHPDSGVAQSPWSKKAVGPADWSVTVAGEHAISEKQDIVIIDVWLGVEVSLDNLNLPSGVTVASGGEIEDYIKRHATEQNE